ncbi:FAD-dependent oxidoreductase [Porticoccaceae bacterium]|nr:FAD-dependent oxidoreductase [Porticoccaceae bacterium]
MAKKIILITAIGGLLWAYFAFDGQRYLSLDFFRDLYAQQPLLTAGVYFAIYVIATAISIPGAALLTIIGGMLFGLWTGILLVSFASSIGATLAFLVSRFLLRDWVQATFSSHLSTINQGIEKQGGYYLFGLRLIPLFPFWMINLVMGLTPLKTSTFYLVSQLGMLAGTFVYVNAGASIGSIDEFSAAGIMTPGVISSFLLLALFPLLVRAVVNVVDRRKRYRGYKKPRKFDTNLIVIGAGSGGLVSAYIGATLKARVTLIERDKMGGDCLNTGCVPSKALIRAAKSMADMKKAAALGINVGAPEVDFTRVMGRVQNVINTIEPHDSVERYTNLGVDCLYGNAKLISPWVVDVDGQQISAEKIIIASGARPTMPSIPGLDQVDPLTSETLWKLEDLPKRFLIVGGGAIGCELAQAFQRLGSQVTLVEMQAQLLPRDDQQVASFMQQCLESEGVRVLTNYSAEKFESHADHCLAELTPSSESNSESSSESSSELMQMEFDRVLIAIGRTANTENLGLEALGVPLNANGTITTDDYLRTCYPNILACGDVVGPYQLTHAASHQAWFAAVNGLLGRFKKFRVDYRIMPQVVFTDPQIGRVGLNQREAEQQGIVVEITQYDLSDLDRAIADNDAQGFIQVLTVPGKDRILGATIVGPQAGELINEFVLAMKHNLGLNKLLGTIRSYPTLSEGNRFVAGEWKRKHVPHRLLAILQRYLGRNLKR